MRRLAAGLWSGFWLLVILVVPPWAMLVWFGWPVPRQPLDQPHLHEWIIAAGVLIAWLLWAILVAVIATETVRAVHRIRLPTLRVTAPPEGFLTGLISAVVVAATSTAARGTLPAATPTPTVATVPQPPPGPTASTADTRANLSMRQAADRVGTAKLAARAQVDAGQVTLVVAGQHYTYTVRRGDTLSHIAAAWLGDPDRWPEIYHLNKGRHFPDVGGTLHNPNLIYPGWILDLPGDAHPPAGTPSAPATGPGGAPPVASKPAPASPPAAGVHHDLDPMPSTPSAASPPAAPAPAGTPATPPAPPAGAPADHDTHRPGVELPGGGWVAAPLAGAVAAAAALVWIHRRRRYRPRPPTGTVRADPDLTPLPETVAILQAAAPRPTREDTMADRAPETAEAATVTPAALGTHAQQTLHLTDLPPHGLGLTGPGAPNAARGLLAAVLSAGGPWAADHEATLLTTTADLNTLLGTDTDPTRFRLDRLHIAATVNHALDDLERHLLHRARFAAEHDTADLTTELSDPDPQPPIVLLTTAPTGNTATRLTTILTVGSRLAITGVLIGAWPDGATWHVNTDGTTHPEQQPDTNGPRLNTLDAAAVVDILQTLVQAHPSDDALMSSLTAAAPAAHAATPARGESPPTPARPAAERAAAPTPSADAATPTARRLRLTVLGRPSIAVVDADTATEVHLRRSDSLSILVYLAVNPHGATSDELMAAIWPETRPHYPRRRFHTTMSELRKTLTETLAADPITRTDGRYHLDPAHIDVDVWHLTATAQQAATTVEPTDHQRLLKDINTRYTGPVADGHNWLWLAPYRETIRRHALDAYIGLADSEPDPRTALALIQQAIRTDPYNEDLYQRAMRLHATLNSPDGVTRTLRALTERLAELEIQISPQTQKTAHDLLVKLEARQR